MNTISKVTMLFAFVTFANTLMATGNLKINITPLMDEKAVVEISNAAASNFQIRITTDKGEVVYYNETDAESNDYRKIFDFSDLGNGKYRLKVTVENLITERSFSIKNKKLTVGKEKNATEPLLGSKNGSRKPSSLTYNDIVE